MAAKYRSYLEEDLRKQLMVVRGMDQKSQAVVLKFPRQTSGTTDEAFVTAQMYITERAIATTEILSEGKAEKVVAVFDFGTYSRANAPPWSAIKTVTQLLQHHYPERLDHLVILDAPLFMRALFQLVHPFLSPETNEKVYMITGEVSVATAAIDGTCVTFLICAAFDALRHRKQREKSSDHSFVLSIPCHL